MARGKKRTPPVEELRSYVEGVAKNLVEKLYGPQGPAWGTKLTQIEDVFLEIREMLTEKMLDETLARQATAGERPAPFRTCPACHAPLPCADANPRILTTRAGEAEWPEPEGYCDRCRRAFFPQSKSLGIDQGETSPALLAKITYAGTASRSFAEGSVLLDKLADLPVPEKRVERITRRIGAERVAEREADVAAFAALPLVEKFAVPSGVTPPPLAVVMADGGRLQIRNAPRSGSAPPEPAPTAATAVGETVAEAEDWQEENTAASRVGHWREDKVGLLLTMTSEAAAADPCPEIPASFLDVVRIPKLVRELHKHVRDGQDAVSDAVEPEAAAEALEAEATYRPPVVRHRQVVASRQTWPAFASLWRRRRGRRGSRGRRGRPSWATARRTTGSCNVASSGRSSPSWTSFTRCPTCSRRRRPGDASRRAGRCIGGGSAGCGKAGWSRSSPPWRRARPSWACPRRMSRKRARDA